jgi:hypothetical protein
MKHTTILPILVFALPFVVCIRAIVAAAEGRFFERTGEFQEVKYESD